METKVKNQMSVMFEGGDTKIEWDSDKEDEVKAARDHFDKLMKTKNYQAYRMTGSGGKGEKIDKFDPHAERIILVPVMVPG